MAEKEKPYFELRLFIYSKLNWWGDILSNIMLQ